MGIIDACGISKGYFRTTEEMKLCMTCGKPNEIIIREKMLAYKNAIDDMIHIINEMRETARFMMNTEYEYACDRFIEQAEQLIKIND